MKASERIDPTLHEILERATMIWLTEPDFRRITSSGFKIEDGNAVAYTDREMFDNMMSLQSLYDRILSLASELGVFDEMKAEFDSGEAKGVD